VGVDLGQAQDHTAVVVVERLELLHMDRNPVTAEFPLETQFRLRHAERVALGSPYPEVVDRVKRLVKRDPLTGRVQVVVDATGVGAPVVDLLKEAQLGCRLYPVVITAGEEESSDGARWRVPRRDLLAGLQVAFQRKRLLLSAAVPALEPLIEELNSMRVRVRMDGGERVEGGRRDDLVFALALAWWRGSREAGRMG
jgi:hypothetical protein